MAVFSYEVINKEGVRQEGTIDAVSEDVAIDSLQRRGLVVARIAKEGSGKGLSMNLTFFERASTKEVVMLSRQISTLFQAQVSALRVFQMLAQEMSNEFLRKTLMAVSADIQGGSSIHDALDKHPKVFSPLYVNMVRAGEESGRLDEAFGHLADYLDRTYAVISKLRNAMVYPAFVIIVFIAVMIFMFTSIVPNITSILVDSGQDIPFYTQIVIGISDFLVAYGIFLLIGVIILGFILFRLARTPEGSRAVAELKLSIPVISDLFRKLYLSRIADNMSTLLSSGIPMVKVIEITATVVGNEVYEERLTEAAGAVRSGSSVSEVFGRYEEIPGILTQMVSVGEESGELGTILDTMADFYRREVEVAIDTIIGMIEPIMIVVLAAGVLLLLVSVLVPIYNISAGF